MKPLIIYHAQCADGFGAAFAAWLRFGDEAEYLACQHGKPPPLMSEILGREVYILDFSFPREVMDAIFTDAKQVIWLDHHKTAFEMWCGEYEKGMSYFEKSADGHGNIIELDDNKSGAMLAWQWFHPDAEVPMLVEHIDDYDRWQFKIDGTKEFNKAIWSYAPWSFEQWQRWLVNWDYKEEAYDSFGYGLFCEGAAILRAHDQNVQSMVERSGRACVIQVPSFKGQDCRTTNYPWHEATGLASNCPPHLTSDVGHELATKSGTFGLLWCIDKDLRCKCSLRSNGDYDVSAIAKAFGGGGHRNAAGFEVPIETLLGWLK